MQNPWLDLPRTPPYVLPIDAEAVARFNESAKDHGRLLLELLPYPRLGDPNAPIVLMSLNPDLSDGNARTDTNSSNGIVALLGRGRGIYNDAGTRPASAASCGTLGPPLMRLSSASCAVAPLNQICTAQTELLRQCRCRDICACWIPR